MPLCDNQSTVRLAMNLVFHKRIKQVEVHYYFLRETSRTTRDTPSENKKSSRSFVH